MSISIIPYHIQYVYVIYCEVKVYPRKNGKSECLDDKVNLGTGLKKLKTVSINKFKNQREAYLLGWVRCGN